MNGVGCARCPPGRDELVEELCSEVKGRAQSKFLQMPVEQESPGGRGGSGLLCEGGLLSQSWKVGQVPCAGKGMWWEGPAWPSKGMGAQGVCRPETLPVGLSFPSPVLR